MLENLMKSSYAKVGMVIVAVVVILHFLSRKKYEKMTDMLADFVSSPVDNLVDIPEESHPVSNVSPMDSDFSGSPAQGLFAQGSNINPDDLLPSNAEADVFSEQKPSGEGNLYGKDFLTAGFQIGINTIGSSLRNANLDIRSAPANPVDSVGPFNNSTITPDTTRRTFEIGQGSM